MYVWFYFVYTLCFLHNISHLMESKIRLLRPSFANAILPVITQNAIFHSSFVGKFQKSHETVKKYNDYQSENLARKCGHWPQNNEYQILSVFYSFFAANLQQQGLWKYVLLWIFKKRRYALKWTILALKSFCCKFK